MIKMIEDRAMLHYNCSAPHIQERESCQLIKLLVEEIQRLKAQRQTGNIDKAIIEINDLIADHPVFMDGSSMTGPEAWRHSLSTCIGILTKLKSKASNVQTERKEDE